MQRTSAACAPGGGVPIPSETVVARAVVRLVPLRKWCAYPSTATGARCGAGLLRWPARVRLYVHGPGTLHVHGKTKTGVAGVEAR